MITLYRALASVVGIDSKYNCFWIRIPARSSDIALRINFCSIPSPLRLKIKEDYRFYVCCDLNDPISMVFENWEIGK